MRIRRITVQHFRNIELATVPVEGRQLFLVGANGQGKTNLLEAIGFLTALRSFRTSDTRVLLQHGRTEAAIACDVQHEQRGDTRVTVRLKAGGKEVSVDQEKITKLGDFLGRFPTVVFSSQDQQLVRGAPAGRRRWLDLTLAATDPDYLALVQSYHRALAERNALLKKGRSGAELDAFERPLAHAGAGLVRKRREGLHVLAEHLTAAYRQIASGESPEHAAFVYSPDSDMEDPEGLRERFAHQRPRDLQFRTTLSGPHRDDFDLTLSDRAAKTFGSEGQQRTLVLALRVAQATWFQRHSGVAPVILADDVLGELDPGRRARFWASLEPAWQVIATGTTLPDAALGEWQIVRVTDGSFA